METKDYYSWKTVENTDKERVSADLIVKARICKSTKLFNKQTKKLHRIETYSQFFNYKKKILNSLEKDSSETDESDFDDNDYKKYYGNLNISSKTDYNHDNFQWHRVFLHEHKSLEPETISEHLVDCDNVDKSELFEIVKSSTKKLIVDQGKDNKLNSSVKVKPNSKSNVLSFQNTESNTVSNGIFNNVGSLVLSPNTSPSVNKSKVENKPIRKSFKEVKRNLSSEINNVTSPVLESVEEDSWNNEFVPTNFQAHSTQIFSDTISENQQNKKKSSRLSLRLPRNENVHQPRDSGIEEDSREENPKCGKVINTVNNIRLEKTHKNNDITDVQRSKIEPSESNNNKIQPTPQKSLSKEESSEKSSQNSNQFSPQSNSEDHQNRGQSLKIIGEEKLTRRYKIIINNSEPLKQVLEETEIKKLEENNAVKNEVEEIKNSDKSNNSNSVNIDSQKIEENDTNEFDSDKNYDLRDEGSDTCESDTEYKSPKADETITEIKELNLKDKLKRCNSPYLMRQYNEMKHLRLLNAEDSSEFSEAKESSKFSKNKADKSPGKKKLKKKKSTLKSPNSGNNNLPNSKRLDEIKYTTEDRIGKRKENTRNSSLEIDKNESVSEKSKSEKKKSIDICPTLTSGNLLQDHELDENECISKDHTEKKEEIENDSIKNHKNENVSKKSKSKKRKLIEESSDSTFLESKENKNESVNSHDSVTNGIVENEKDNNKKSKIIKLKQNNLFNDKKDTKNNAIINKQSDISDESNLEELKINEKIQCSKNEDHDAEDISASAKKHLQKYKKFDFFNNNSSDSSDEEVAHSQVNINKKQIIALPKRKNLETKSTNGEVSDTFSSQSSQVSDRKRKKKKKDQINELRDRKLSLEIEPQQDLTKSINYFKEANYLKSLDVSSNQISENDLQLKSKTQKTQSSDLFSVKFKYNESDQEDEMSVSSKQQLQKIKRLDLFGSDKSEDSENEEETIKKFKSQLKHNNNRKKIDNKSEEVINTNENILSNHEKEKKNQEKKNQQKVCEFKNNKENAELNSSKIVDKEKLDWESEHEEFNHDNSDIDIEEHKIVMPDDFNEFINKFDDNVSNNEVDHNKSHSLKKSKKMKTNKIVKDKNSSSSEDAELVNYNNENENITQKKDSNFNYDSETNREDENIDTISPQAIKRLNQFKRLNLYVNSDEDSDDDEKINIVKNNCIESKKDLCKSKNTVTSGSDSDSESNDNKKSDLLKTAGSLKKKHNIQKNNNENKEAIIISETQESETFEQNNLESQNMFPSSEDLTKDSIEDKVNQALKSDNENLATQIEEPKTKQIKTLSDFIEAKSLIDADCESTTALTDFLPDDPDVNIFLIEVPKNILNKKLINKQFSISNKTLVIGDTTYKAIEKQPTPSLCCIFKSGRNSKNTFKTINFRPCASIVSNGIKLPEENGNCNKLKNSTKSPKISKNNTSIKNSTNSSPCSKKNENTTARSIVNNGKTPEKMSKTSEKIVKKELKISEKIVQNDSKLSEKIVKNESVLKIKKPENIFTIKNFVMNPSKQKSVASKSLGKKKVETKTSRKRKLEETNKEKQSEEVVEKKKKKIQSKEKITNKDKPKQTKKSKKKETEKKSIVDDFLNFLGVGINFARPQIETLNATNERYGSLNVERAPSKTRDRYHSTPSSDEGDKKFLRRSFKIQCTKKESEDDEKSLSSLKDKSKNSSVYFDE